MAGIVASTLRRKAFHRGARGSDQAKFVAMATSAVAQSSETVGPGNTLSGSGVGAGPTTAGHAASYSPSAGGSRPSSRSSSFAFRSTELDDQQQQQQQQQRQGTGIGLHHNGHFGTQKHTVAGAAPGATAWGTDLDHADFWPMCVNPIERDLQLIRFETFDTLIPKVNTWILMHTDIRVVKCETLEKKVTSVDQVTGNSVMFVPSADGIAICVKGLRLWYVITDCVNTVDFAAENSTDRKQTPGCGGAPSTPVEIGYMNVIPKCNEWAGTFPVYESLPETYAAINTYLTDQPLEGRILTVETVSIRLGAHHQKRPQIDADQTCFSDSGLRHTVYITRIYFIYGEPGVELIGAQDFLPEYQTARGWNNFRASYCQLASVMRKVREWIKNAKHISVTNIQTLEAVCKKNTEHIHTGSNFVERSCGRTKLVRFVRITYVRPIVHHGHGFHYIAASNKTASVSTNNATVAGGPGAVTGPAAAVQQPVKPGFAYRTFTPAPIKVAMCSGQPEYEPFESTWDRARAWISTVNRGVIGVESVVHPLRLLWQDQDGAETTVIEGDCRAPSGHGPSLGPANCLMSCCNDQSYVEIVRVYLNGDFHEPAQNLLPPVPMVEEVKDCGCIIV